MKRISLEELHRKRPGCDYKELAAYVAQKVSDGSVKPVKTSGLNGKSPALYREYWILEQEPDYGDLLNELKYDLVPMISNDYYLDHPEVYERERAWVLKLNRFFKHHRDALNMPESVNERSFEIWGEEKFLKKGRGMVILKHCNIRPEELCYYETTEPLAGYTHTRQVPQNLLILENKDTFYSMRRHLMETDDNILGVKTGTLIYGAGKGILNSFRDFSVCAESYMQDKGNRIFYLGDLDYEGIGIYENLAGMSRPEQEILPFVPGYQAMLKKAEPRLRWLPKTKEGQNRNIGGSFFSYFTKEEAALMKQILESDCYIPQEILNGQDF